MLLEPNLELQHEGLTAGLADGAALIGAAASDGLLYGIQCGDPRQRLGGDRRRAGKSTIAEHIRYALNDWDGLTRFLEDGPSGRPPVWTN